MKIPAQTALNDADITRTLRRMMVPVGMTIEDVMTPGTWAHVFSKVKIDDEIIVWPEDRAWRLHLLVVDIGPGYVQTDILHQWARAGGKQEVEAEAVKLDVPDGYRVDHTPKTGWRAFTKEPPLEISRNHKSHNDAVRAAVTHAAKSGRMAA